MDEENPKRKTLAALTSVVANSFLIILKATAGILTGSIAILSDAIQSMIDLVASVIALVAVRRSDAPPDAEHRYGHSKFEDVSASVQALLLMLGALVIAEQAVRRLSNGGSISHYGVGVIAAGVAALINFGVSLRLRRTSRATGSTALAADGTHQLADAAMSFSVFLTLIIIHLTGAEWLDPVVGLVFATILAVTGFRILFGSGRRLTDYALPAKQMDELDETIQDFIARHDIVVSYHDLRARRAGGSAEIDFHLQFDDLSLADAHLLSHQLKDEITERFPRSSVLIHLEPVEVVRESNF
jgi:cation diffusion facilitator family transporter